MPSEQRAQENSPHDHCPAADRKHNQPNDDGREVVIIIEETKIFVFEQIGRIALPRSLGLNLGGAAEYPAHMRPIRACSRAMRVAVGIRKRVMNAMGRYPRDRSRL